MRNSIFALAAALGCAAAYANLEDGFRNPPHDAKPHTWWHWMNGNVTKEGITADLEAMAEIGLGGAQIFDAGCDIPAGPIAYNSPEWFDVVKHAAAEARRLGIELCLPNCSGWSSSGGPWNPPANGMKELDWTETKVAGPATFSAKLPQPPNNHGFYDDIAVDFPDLKLVMCHGGRDCWYKEAVTVARLHENVFIDVAGLPPKKLLTYFPDLPRLAHKFVFGTDWPSVDIGKNADDLARLPLPEESVRGILGETAKGLLGL